ncbi:tRNA (guanine(37)-N1)-methyltransferase isoform X1 [Bacillus rossius redtenbacheri]|uniref:tRNA (guanine(37)-N1)-methyltransferase isoform X1 n=1 Tax=Bacillus rossius redtenbacheri TaxID=93214 RepID=UPI002FDCEBCE
MVLGSWKLCFVTHMNYFRLYHKFLIVIGMKNLLISQGKYFWPLICDTRWVVRQPIMTSSSCVDLEKLLEPPSSVRGMKKLNRELFTKKVNIPWLELESSKLDNARKYLKPYLLKLPKFKNFHSIVNGSDVKSDTKVSGERAYLKRVALQPVLVRSFESIREIDREHLKDLNITKENFCFSEINLTYENWRADQILNAVLPEEKEKVTSYSLVGHIVHLNLREHVLEYKNIIGEVLLDKVVNAKTVVNKTDMIDNTYRNFKMELLCGEDCMVAEVKENHCTFKFDFSAVYWNPRLGTEHERIVNMLKEGDVLYDVFAGVGPFAVPAAKKRCSVLANDLNPECCKWLQHNMKVNKVDSYLQLFNKDGAEFIRDNVKKHMLFTWQAESKYPDIAMHITMNLPALAVTFLKTFVGLFTLEEIGSIEIQSLPIVHVYCFVKDEKPLDAARRLVEDSVGVDLGSAVKDVILVRNVSVGKNMMRVTFLLEKNLLCNVGQKLGVRTAEENVCGEPNHKKQCLGVNGENGI